MSAGCLPYRLNALKHINVFSSKSFWPSDKYFKAKGNSKATCTCIFSFPVLSKDLWCKMIWWHSLIWPWSRKSESDPCAFILLIFHHILIQNPFSVNVFSLSPPQLKFLSDSWLNSVSVLYRKTLEVKIIDDEEYEKNKTFTIHLGEPILLEIGQKHGKETFSFEQIQVNLHYSNGLQQSHQSWWGKWQTGNKSRVLPSTSSYLLLANVLRWIIFIFVEPITIAPSMIISKKYAKMVCRSKTRTDFFLTQM